MLHFTKQLFPFGANILNEPRVIYNRAQKTYISTLERCTNIITSTKNMQVSSRCMHARRGGGGPVQILFPLLNMGSARAHSSRRVDILFLRAAPLVY